MGYQNYSEQNSWNGELTEKVPQDRPSLSMGLVPLYSYTFREILVLYLIPGLRVPHQTQI